MWITVNSESANVDWHGYDHGKAVAVKITPTVIVVKFNGKRYSYGNMPTDNAYAPTEFRVFGIVETERLSDTLTRYQVDEIVNFPVRGRA